MSSSKTVFSERFEDQIFYSGSSILWTLNLSILSVILAFMYYYYKFNKPKKVTYKRIPGPKVNGIITNIIPLLSIFRNKAASNSALLYQMVNAYSHVFRKEGMWMFYGGFKKILILYKAETVEPILSSNENIGKGFEYEFITPMLKEGLLTSKKDKWRYRRKLLTPSFHFRILDEFIPIFNEQANIFASKIAANMEITPWIDIAPLASLCTLDIICETAMGKKLKAQINSESPYVKALHQFCHAAIDRLLRPWLWPDFLFHRTNKGKEFFKNLKIMDDFTRQVIAERKAEKLQEQTEGTTKEEEINDEIIGRKLKRRLALLDLLLDLHLKDESFTLDDVAEEVDNFMFAGHDTTSSGLSWALYMLGIYPEIQRKVHEEIDDVLGDDEDRQITLDDIKNLKYLDCVLKESRRLWPPTPFIARDLDEDVVIDGCLIPKGTSCGILIFMLHRDPDVFPNPEKFDPNRFLLENSTGRHPFAYIPFSAGPRNCIGQRFAIFEAVTVMATILKKFKVKSLDPIDRIHTIDELVLRSDQPLRMTFEPRKLGESLI
ncbi:cytochrome P450 4c3 [Trichonephila inaurata madagascariensis]|uniref:Cytochrome P450 4c3 n=1 Tax=Trichonephila inaurata madagascariensis TaxID=2747483 RepID=A0A8X6X2U8_9ARAC|nr:cytochrome P450 4c3 [Trichonephila inaurata madagascariensis]